MTDFFSEIICCKNKKAPRSSTSATIFIFKFLEWRRGWSWLSPECCCFDKLFVISRLLDTQKWETGCHTERSGLFDKRRVRKVVLGELNLSNCFFCRDSCFGRYSIILNFWDADLFLWHLTAWWRCTHLITAVLLFNK